MATVLKQGWVFTAVSILLNSNLPDYNLSTYRKTLEKATVKSMHVLTINLLTMLHVIINLLEYFPGFMEHNVRCNPKPKQPINPSIARA